MGMVSVVNPEAKGDAGCSSACQTWEIGSANMLVMTRSKFLFLTDIRQIKFFIKVAV